MCLVRVRKSRAAVAVTEATGTVSACFQKRIDWQNPGVAEDTNPVWLRPSPPLLPYEAPWAQSPNNDIRYTKNAWKQDAAVIARLYDEIQRNGFPHLQTHLTDADFREARGILRGMDAGRRQVANDRALEIIHSQKSLMSQVDSFLRFLSRFRDGPSEEIPTPVPAPNGLDGQQRPGPSHQGPSPPYRPEPGSPGPANRDQFSNGREHNHGDYSRHGADRYPRD